ANHQVSVYTGRLTRNKGLFELLDAWRLVVNRQPHSQLWLIGEGPDREALYDRIRELKLVGHILMPGAFDDVDDLLQAANTFILPSYMEGLSLSLLEAMANQVHVIASNIAGNRQLIDNNVHGRLVTVKKVAPLAEAILAAHATDNSNMVQAAYQRVRQEFSLESMAQKHLQVFESTLRSGA
ncbi:MAG: glycosyltransferase, partial [Planctomycetota bacterium]|nr:glycosyltransferase [Planctomycetota bacterium]